MALFLAFAPPQAAAAWLRDDADCRDSTITWHFDSAWNNFPDAKTWARNAIQLWNQPLDYDGLRLMTLVEGVPGAGVSVQILNGPANVYGQAECVAGASIWINSDFAGSQSFVWQLARHEMGHLLGFNHTGSQDSHSGDNPSTMSTCIDRSNFRSVNQLSQDDNLLAHWWWSKLSLPKGHQANVGYERGKTWWAASSGSTLEWQSTEGATGPGRLRHTTPNSSHYLIHNEQFGGRAVEQAAVNYKLGNATHRGSFNVVVYLQEVDYEDLDTCSDNFQYPTDDPGNPFIAEMNRPRLRSTGLFAFVSTGWITSTGVLAWQKATSAVDSASPPNTYEGFKVVIKVFNHAETSTNTPTWTYLDNVRS